MNDFVLEGTGNMTGGEYGVVKIDGIVTCTGDMKAKTIHIDGIFKSRGTVETDLLDCDGMTEFDGSVRAKKILVDGMMTMSEESRIEAEEIKGDGLIKGKSEISADRIEIYGGISAKEIVGDRIKIHFKSGPISSKIMHNICEIGMVEATEIDLLGVRADEVNGKDIRIGKRCRIKKVDCSGTLHIDKKASVEEICGDYTIIE